MVFAMIGWSVLITLGLAGVVYWVIKRNRLVIIEGEIVEIEHGHGESSGLCVTVIVKDYDGVRHVMRVPYTIIVKLDTPRISTGDKAKCTFDKYGHVKKLVIVKEL